MECPTQVWGYDDLQEFQATQSDLSTQLGRTPALAFCPSCGIFLLDTGSTDAQRDAHIQSCRDVEDPDGLEILSEGEDSDDASEETPILPGRGQTTKKQKPAAHQGQPRSKDQENSLHGPSLGSVGGVDQQHCSEPQPPDKDPVTGVLAEEPSSASAHGEPQQV